MKTLSGLVALLDTEGNVQSYRNLGPIPIQVKDYVVPVEDIYPSLKDGEEYGAPTVETRDSKVVRTWTAVKTPVQIDYSAFRSRWTSEELEALHRARQADWRVDDFVGLAQAQGHINLTGSIAPQAKALFVALGVLTNERADEVFKT